MRYLCVIDKLETGGAEKLLLNYSSYLQNKGHDVYIYVLYKGVVSNQVNTSDVYYGLRNNSNNFFSKGFDQIYLFIKLLFYVYKLKPDCIYSFLERSNVLVSLLPIKIPKCLTVHNVLSIQYLKVKNKLIRKITTLIINTTYNRCSDQSIIAVSSQVKDDLVQKFGISNHKIIIINNCVDVEQIHSKSLNRINEYYFDEGIFYILNVGRLSLQKAQWKLLKAMYYIISSIGRLDIKLVIIGDGELYEQYIQYIKSHNLNDYVTILKYNDNPYKFMVKSDLFVLPSLYEGFPIVLSEVSALNKPFIGSKRAVPQEMINSNEDWNNITYSNLYYTNDLDKDINADDINLSNLILKNLSNNHRKSFSSNWNKHNDFVTQFDKYNNVCNGNFSV